MEVAPVEDCVKFRCFEPGAIIAKPLSHALLPDFLN